MSLVLSIGLVGAGAAFASDRDGWTVLRILGMIGWPLGLLFGILGIA